MIFRKYQRSTKSPVLQWSFRWWLKNMFVSPLYLGKNQTCCSNNQLELHMYLSQGSIAFVKTTKQNIKLKNKKSVWHANMLNKSLDFCRCFQLKDLKFQLKSRIHHSCCQCSNWKYQSTLQDTKVWYLKFSSLLRDRIFFLISSFEFATNC